MLKKLLLIALFVGIKTAFAQTNLVVSGILEDTGNKRIVSKPIGLIDAKSSKLIKQTITDQFGKFMFTIDNQVVSAGIYQILILDKEEKVNKFFKTIEIKDNVTNYDLGVVVIEVSPIMITEVSIISSAPIYDRKLDKLVVNVENSILSTGNTISEILEKLPGINIDQSGGITVNGKSGVLLTIDGRGQYVQKEQVSSIISSMRSESIKQLEIIANPSSKYDASQGSVINIITKKNYAKSDFYINNSIPFLRGSSMNRLAYPSFGIGTNLNYQFGKLSSNLSIGFTANKSYSEVKYITTYNNLGVTKDNNIQSKFRGNNLNTRWGLTYDLNNKSALSLDLFLITKPGGTETITDDPVLFYSNANRPDSIILSDRKDNNKSYRNFSLTAQYGLKLDTSNKKRIDFYYDLTDFNNPFTNGSNLTFLNDLGVQTDRHFFESTRKYRIQQHAIKVDYTHNFSKITRLFTGLKLAFTKTSDSVNAQRIDNVGITALPSGQFNYRESIAGAYVMVATKIKKLEGQIGLRSEMTFTNGRTTQVNGLADKTYTDLFPSASFQYAFNQTNKVGLSYNRRIVRIGFGDLNPIGLFQSSFVISEGNPDLKSSFINYLELNYQFKQLYVGLSYSNQANSRIDIPQRTENAALQTNLFTNVQAVNTYQLDISYPITISKWWRIYNNLSVSNNEFLVPANRLSYTGYRLNINQTFKISNTSSVEFLLRYNSKYQSYYSMFKDIFTSNLGSKQSLFNKRLDVVLNLSDIFGTNKFNMRSEYPDQLYTMASNLNSRMGSISLKYNFNSGNAFGRQASRSKGEFGEKRF